MCIMTAQDFTKEDLREKRFSQNRAMLTWLCPRWMPSAKDLSGNKIDKNYPRHWIPKPLACPSMPSHTRHFPDIFPNSQSLNCSSPPPAVHTSCWSAYALCSFCGGLRSGLPFARTMKTGHAALGKLLNSCKVLFWSYLTFETTWAPRLPHTELLRTHFLR